MLFTRSFRRVLTQMVKACSPKEVVDLATGSGDVAFKLRDRIGIEVPVTGLDFCEPMLDEARAKRAAKKCYSDIAFEFGDCMDLPLEDNSVDAFTISFGVRNFENRQRGLKEILRVLRPGGRLFVLEFSQPVKWFCPIYYFYLNTKDHSSRSSSHLFLFFNSESRHAAANARTISDPLVSDLVRETVPARLPRRSPIRKR